MKASSSNTGKVWVEQELLRHEIGSGQFGKMRVNVCRQSEKRHRKQEDEYWMYRDGGDTELGIV